MSLTRLVVNADDFGLAESVNRGIVDTIEIGIVTSTSLIVNMPARDDAIRRLRYLRASGKPVSVGLHFNIVAGPPLSDCPSITDARTGEFFPLSQLLWKSVARKIDLADVQRELDAQLDCITGLLAKLNMRVTHLDSHRHTHCLPGIFELFQRTAKDRGIPHVRHPYETHPSSLRPRGVIASKILRAILYRQRPSDDVCFTGVGVMASRSFHRDLSQLIGKLPQGTTELMVHPGYDSDELAAIDSYRAAREREVHALISPRLREQIAELGVQLTTFAEAPSARAPSA